MTLENLRPFVAELEVATDFIPFEDHFTLNWGEKPKGAEKVVQIRVTHTQEEDMFKTSATSCGCTTPKIKDVDNLTQILEVGYNTEIKGDFTKTVTFYTQDKKRKQRVKITGKIS